VAKTSNAAKIEHSVLVMHQSFHSFEKAGLAFGEKSRK
jgi:hypothetical protein